MNFRYAELPFFLSLVLISWLLQWLSTRELLAYIPAIILLPLLVTWLIPHKGWYLGIIAVIGELYSTLPPGIVVLAVLVPYFLYRFRGRIEVDLSFMFLFWTGLSVGLSTLVMTTADIFYFLHLSTVSVRILGLITLLTTLAGFSLILALHWLQPREHRYV